jgi:hypothetical protein
MDLGSILLGVALLFIVAFLVARPWLEPAAGGETEADPAAPLLLERERTLAALRDLDFDYATGKLPDDDYAAQRAQLVAQGADVLRQLDALAPAGAPAPIAGIEDEIEAAIARRRTSPAPAAPRRAAEAGIEAAIAQRRQPGAARFCGQCGQPLRPGDRFCGACGAPVPAEQAAKG